MGTATQYAWAAGIIDGEGCITINTVRQDRRENTRLALVVGCTSPEMVMKMKTIFGGTIVSYARKHVRLPVFHWWLQSRPAAEALSLMLPYLVVKKTQAELAIEFAKTIQSKKDRPRGLAPGVRERRREMETQMKALKRPPLEVVA